MAWAAYPPSSVPEQEKPQGVAQSPWAPSQHEQPGSVHAEAVRGVGSPLWHLGPPGNDAKARVIAQIKTDATSFICRASKILTTGTTLLGFRSVFPNTTALALSPGPFKKITKAKWYCQPI